MLPETIAERLVVALYLAPLLVAAVTDLRRFRIPNVVTGAMLALFPVAALLAPQPVDWLSHLAAGGLTLGAGFALFAFGLFGGGDVKLLAAAALWLGLGQLLSLVLLVAVVGGVLALLLLLLRSPRLQAVVAYSGRAPAVLQQGAAVPYGVAIAIAGAWLVPSLPLI